MNPFTYLDVDGSALAGIAVLAFIDLAVRYFVFHRLESIALDVALFSTAYSVVEATKEITGSFAEGFSAEGSIWAQRAIGDIVCVVLAALVHIWLDERLRSKVESAIETQRGSGTVRQRSLQLAKPLIRRTILLTFTGPELPAILREGKREWRQDAVEFINYQIRDTITEADLLLSRPYRYLGGALFFLVGLIAVLIPTVTLHS